MRFNVDKKMTQDYTIKIVGRGENIVYESDGKKYVFEVSFSSIPYKLYADQYSREDLSFRQFDVTVDERQIIERIADWITEKDGQPVRIVDKGEIHGIPLRSVDDIFQDNMRRRDSRKQEAEDSGGNGGQRR